MRPRKPKICPSIRSKFPKRITFRQALKLIQTTDDFRRLLMGFYSKFETFKEAYAFNRRKVKIKDLGFKRGYV